MNMKSQPIRPNSQRSKPVLRLLLGLLAMGFFAQISAPVLAQGKNAPQAYVIPPKFNAQDAQRIKSATTYLQSLATGTGRFAQTDYRGRVTIGTWYLQRPGKMRFDYDAPFAQTVVADGKWVSVWDARLKTFDKYPQGETPLALFLSKQIRFDQGVIITSVTLLPDGFRLKARDRRRDIEGSITMDFSDKAGLVLKGWTVIDAQNRPTEIKLVTLDRQMSIKPSLFVLKAPPVAPNP